MDIEKYQNFIISTLPLKGKYTTEDLKVDNLLIEKENNLEIFYSPFDFINKKAKIVIVGITPGFTQMEKAIRGFKNRVRKGETREEAIQNVKKDAAFAGPMRTNLVNMLNEIELNKHLRIETCDSLFNEYNYLIHSTSIIKYPVFKKKSISKKGKIRDNYNGSSPKILESEMLKKYVECFFQGLKEIDYSIIIPLGKAVSEVLEKYPAGISADKCLFGFPNPSGANGSRVNNFNERKDEFKEKVKRIFEKE